MNTWLTIAPRHPAEIEFDAHGIAVTLSGDVNSALYDELFAQATALMEAGRTAAQARAILEVR